MARPKWLTHAAGRCARARVRLRQDYNNMGVDLFDREKVHINLLIMEARRQAELVYFAHAVARATGD